MWTTNKFFLLHESSLIYTKLNQNLTEQISLILEQQQLLIAVYNLMHPKSGGLL